MMPITGFVVTENGAIFCPRLVACNQCELKTASACCKNSSDIHKVALYNDL